MSFSARRVDAAVMEALTCWPGIVGAAPAPNVLARLIPWCNVLLDELPWWDRAWRVTWVEPAYPLLRDPEERARTGRIEVSVPGAVSHAGDADLSFFARVSLEGDQLVHCEVKVGGVVLRPTSTPVGRPEPHPFGAVLYRLMRLRGMSVAELSRRSLLAETTVSAACRGAWNPHHRMITALANGLDMAEEDLLAIAGLDTT